MRYVLCSVPEEENFRLATKSPYQAAQNGMNFFVSVCVCDKCHMMSVVSLSQSAQGTQYGSLGL